MHHKGLNPMTHEFLIYQLLSQHFISIPLHHIQGLYKLFSLTFHICRWHSISSIWSLRTEERKSLQWPRLPALALSGADIIFVWYGMRSRGIECDMHWLLFVLMWLWYALLVICAHVSVICIAFYLCSCDMHCLLFVFMWHASPLICAHVICIACYLCSCEYDMHCLLLVLMWYALPVICAHVISRQWEWIPE